MARVTTEDCLMHVESRFDLVLLASRRARDLYAGAQPTVEQGNDKPSVVALREIAHADQDEESLKMCDLQESIVRRHQQHLPEEDDMPESFE